MKDLFKQAWQEASIEVKREMNIKQYAIPCHELQDKLADFYKTNKVRLDVFARQDIKDHPTYSRL